MRKPPRLVVAPVVIIFFGTILFLCGQVVCSAMKEFWPVIRPAIKIIIILAVAAMVLGGPNLLVYSLAKSGGTQSEKKKTSEIMKEL